MISLKPDKKGFDVVLISGDAYVDHPAFGPAIIARVLEGAGYSVGIVAQPDWKTEKEVKAMGKPRLFYGITAGNMDSMVANYTPLKNKREYDHYTNKGQAGKRPDRAVTVYANLARKAFKDAPVVIGGIEASLRRLAHYDYWEESVRRSILLDSKADVLAYGMGEHAVVELARYYEKHGREDTPTGIENTCVVLKEPPAGHVVIPSYEEVACVLPGNAKPTASDMLLAKRKFCEATRLYHENEKVAQMHDKRFVVQYPMHRMTTAELDAVYELPFTRTVPKGTEVPAFEPVKFSITTHRGCFGKCSFCAITLHQGKLIQSRSEESVLREVRRIIKMPGYGGTIDDLGGPSANMYGMECARPCAKGDCFRCPQMDRSHKKVLSLMRRVRAEPGVEKAFVSSGIRYDLAVLSNEYLKELVAFHTPGRLKVAPEHANAKVLKLMNKPDFNAFKRFLLTMWKIDRNFKILPYFIAAHPGSGVEEMREVMEFIKVYGEFEQCQTFTPTPMTLSTCMYYTGMEPYSLQNVYVPRAFAEKKVQKAMLLPSRPGYKERLAGLDAEQDD